MSKTILIEERAVYGRFNYYVVSEHAAAVRFLTKKLTVDISDVGALETLGFSVRVMGRVEMPAREAMQF